MDTRRTLANAGTRIAAILAAAYGAAFISHNWCFVCLLASLAALVLDILFCALAGNRVRRRTFRIAGRVALGLVVGLAIGWQHRVTPEWAFQEAFGVQPPPGIRDVHVWRHYLGGPGEHALIIEFHADHAAIEALEAAAIETLRPLKTYTVEWLESGAPDSRRVEEWRDSGGSWEAAWESFAGPARTRFSRTSWMRIRPLDAPRVLDYGYHLVLMVDETSGRAVALHVRP